ncbi:EamA family transporter [Rhizobium sp. KVB221]|uniref:EamA family transporter n=2 Tax=Rhizobium setariae TaxID=2801340 RepID=A0A937CNP7_9HYPH|nr:EamA family transporter [Rhizobium setariae]
MAIIFGLGWVFTKGAMSHFPPVLLAAFRFAVTALVLVWFVRMPTGKWRDVAFISIFAFGIPYSLSYTAMKDLDVSTSVLLAQMEAPALILVAAILLRETPTTRQAFGIGLALVGVVLLIGVVFGQGNVLAVVLSLASTVVWALGQIKVRTLTGIGGFSTLAWASLFAVPQLLLISFVLETGHAAVISTASTGSWLAVIYLGVVMTALGIGIWYQLLGRVPVIRLAPFLLLVPLISILGSVLLLGERPTLLQLLGGLIILAGVAIVLTERTANDIAEAIT